MAIEQAGIDQVVAEGNWRLFRESDSITQIDSLPVVTTRIVIRVLPDVPRMDLDSIKTALGATKQYASPKVQGRTYAGTWTNGGHYVEESAVDQNRGATVNLFQVLYQGTASTLTVVTERSCRFLVESIYYYGLTTPPTLPSAGSGISYEFQSLQQQERGGWNAVVLKRTRQYQNTGVYRAETTAAETTTEQKQLGVTDQTIPTITAAALSDGERASQDILPTADCAKDVTTRIGTAVDQTQTEVEVKASQTITRTTHTQLADGSLPANPPVPANGESKVLRIVPTAHKARNQVTEETRAGVKLEKNTTWTDADGSNRNYEGSNLTASEVTTQLGTVTATNRIEVSCTPSPEYKNLFNLFIRERPPSQSSASGDMFGSGDVEYEVTSSAGVRTYIGIKYTTSKTSAKNWLTTAATTFNSYTYTTIKLSVDGIKTFPHPLGRGRFMAVRVWQ